MLVAVLINPLYQYITNYNRNLWYHMKGTVTFSSTVPSLSVSMLFQ